MSAAVTALTPDPPSPSTWLLGLVVHLINYGKALASSLRQQGIAALGDNPGLFGTDDIALILQRITRGLMRAAALHEKIVISAVSLDAAPKPPRLPRERGTARAAAQSAAKPDPRLATLPTEAQIVAEVLRRPIGSVLADICRDLGILPGHPLWLELRRAISRYRGNYTRLVKDMLNRMRRAAPPLVAPAALPASGPATAGTGPPSVADC